MEKVQYSSFDVWSKSPRQVRDWADLKVVWHALNSARLNDMYVPIRDL